METPMMQELETGGKIAGSLLALWAVFRLITGVGKIQQKYEDLVLDVTKIKDEYMTIEEHDKIQALCKSNTIITIDEKIRGVADPIKEEINIVNSNVCLLLGAHGLEPVKSGRQDRRRDDRKGR